MFHQKYQSYLDLIEDCLIHLPFTDNLICQSMNYSLVGGGKRVRPVLALACVEIVGERPENFVREAAALELIHTYSLIHDDLPAMDNDDFRRGKPSNHKAFGEAAAILAGDALLTFAFEMLSQSLEIGPEKQLRVIRETAQASGWQGMVGGQVLDTVGNGQKSGLKEIESIHRMKTGALLTASARLGAILGGGTEEEIQCLSKYASYLGLAFQIKDDILDIVGESQILGKPARSDEKLQKPTYPAILGLQGADDCLKRTIASAKDAIGYFGFKAEFLSELADYVGKRDH
ncbi:MAG: Farnesyl diphosphate synthase [Candidatus Dichloromethanomonas elyunquensis]|nr:MAG: Farnesyl diphosphate synthase [Candidatus Dichloromethanomonas elyunquensis]